MCRAIPRKIIETDGRSAVVEDGDQKLKVSLADDSMKKGDFVFVYADLAIEKVDENEAKKIFKEYK